MSIDWNWFFSSFCQSAAALIGIIAAFIISRLLGLSEKINSTISHFDNLVIEHTTITNSFFKRNFYWYVKSVISHDIKLKKDIDEGDYDGLSQEDILAKVYEMKNRLYRVDDAVMEGFNELYEKKGKSTAISSNFVSSDFWNSLEQEKESINQLEVEAMTLIQRFKQNLQDLKSFDDSIKPLKVIVILLMIAFPLTVIYPLHFMPVVSNQSPILIFNPIVIFKMLFSIKSILLTLFFLTIEGIFYYFIILTNQLKKKLSEAIENNSDEYKNIKSYSEYLNDN